MKKILIKKAIAISKKDKILNKIDILIENGKISHISDNIKPLKHWKTINAERLWLFPGLIDVHVHTRIPGAEKNEDFKSLTKAALSCGVTTILAMPNTDPPTDENILPYLIKKAKKETPLNILFSSCITKGRKGELSADFEKAANLGAKAFTDDGSWVKSEKIMREALTFSAKTKIPILSHCQLPGYEGAVNEGRVSKLLKIKGQPAKAEYEAALRDIKIALETGGRLHIQHVSCAQTVRLINKFKSPSITAETCPHYFWFTQENIKNGDTNFKMNPPLRRQTDLKRIIEALKQNTIQIISSDHAPHSLESKKQGIEKAPFGVIGIETLLYAAISVLILERMHLPYIFEKMTSAPAELLNLKNKGVLSVGSDADLVILNADKLSKFKKFYSKSSNSPFFNQDFIGVVEKTFLGGKLVYDKGKFFI
ncbi:MAG: dihydroorotase [Elusimicrobiota bacterium]